MLAHFASPRGRAPRPRRRRPRNGTLRPERAAGQGTLHCLGDVLVDCGELVLRVEAAWVPRSPVDGTRSVKRSLFSSTSVAIAFREAQTNPTTAPSPLGGAPLHIAGLGRGTAAAQCLGIEGLAKPEIFLDRGALHLLERVAGCPLILEDLGVGLVRQGATVPNIPTPDPVPTAPAVVLGEAVVAVTTVDTVTAVKNSIGATPGVPCPTDAGMLGTEITLLPADA